MGHRTKIAEGQYLHGLDEAAEKLQTLVDAMAGASAQGLSDASLFILGDAAKRAPVDTGNLRGSGYVELDGQQVAKGAEGGGCTLTGAGPEDAAHAEIGFNAKYAADQHEQVHLSHPRGGQAKYLESVLVEEQERILATITGRVEEAMGGRHND